MSAATIEARQRRLLNVWLTARQYERLTELSNERGSTMSDTVRVGIALVEATEKVKAAPK